MATSRTYKLRSPKAGTTEFKYADSLNEQQAMVVRAEPGPALVIAGAGSGKTRTLTYRVAHLIDQGIRPQEILLLTFTNRAAKEMAGRVAELLHQDARAIWGGTFHSVGSRVLRQHAVHIGYDPKFTILDREDSIAVMRACVAEMPSKPDKKRFPKAGTILGWISRAINTGQKIESLVAETAPHFADMIEPILDASLAYTGKKFEIGVMDFDDLLLHWARLLQTNATVRDACRRQFRAVLVDEYQDTNALQCQIVDTIAEQHRNLMVVGDDSQSIFAFRGAEYRNILEFPVRYPDCEVYRLERNYRSSPEIVAFANQSIAHNESGFDKTLVSMEPEGPPPAVVSCRSDAQQGQFIANRILDLRDEGVSLDRIALLYRAHWHSVEVQVALNQHGIPFVVRSGTRFFEQKHIKDVLAFLKFTTNPRDELSFMRVANLVEGVGAKTAQRLFRRIREAGDPSIGLTDEWSGSVVPPRAKKSWAQSAEMMRKLSSELYRSRAGEAITLIRESFYEPYARRTYDGFANRLREIETLADYASQHGSMGDALSSLALEGPISGADIQSEEGDDEHVVLSTIHQAKGLEFHAVFILWAADGRFPSAYVSSDEEFEEERRLFYVAATRAERELYATWPMTHVDRNEGFVMLRPSPFISELERLTPCPFEHWDVSA